MRFPSWVNRISFQNVESGLLIKGRGVSIISIVPIGCGFIPSYAGFVCKGAEPQAQSTSPLYQKRTLPIEPPQPARRGQDVSQICIRKHSEGGSISFLPNG